MADDILRLTGRIELHAGAGDKPKRLAIVAYSGGMMNVANFGDVAIDLAGMTLPASLPILADHENRLGSVIASGTPSVSNGALSVLAQLADSPAATSVVALLASGVELQASVGAVPTQRKYLSPNQTAKVNGRDVTAGAKGLTLIERSVLREISVTPLGADPSTSVSLAAKQQKGERMNETTPPHPVAPQRTEDEILRAERARIAGIEASARGFEDFPAVMEVRARAIEGLANRDDVDAAALEVIRARRVPAGTGMGSFPGQLGTTHRGTAKPEDILAASLMVKAGYESAALAEFGPHVLEQSRPLHNASLVDLARASLSLEGRPIPSDRHAMLRAASVGSMPTALGSSMDKVLATVYRSAPASWRSFAAIKSTPNFRQQSSVRPSFPADLAKLGPSGEIEHTSYAEEVYSWRISTFARQLRVDRTAWVNDDLGAFMQVIPSFAKSASRTLSGLVAEVLLANSGSHWGSDNGNYISGSDTNLQASSLATAILKLRQMKDAENNVLDLQPSVLLLPPELEQVGKALVTSSTLMRYVASNSDNQPTGNPLQAVAQVVVEPRLSDPAFTGYSTTAWYLFSAPENEAVVVGFLDGRDRPIIEEFGLDSDINHLSYGFRCYFDFGCSLADHRASVKSKGAA